MKYVVLALVLVGVVWLWRHQRDSDARDAAAEAAKAAKKRRATAPPEPPKDIVACPVCGLHSPLADTVPGALARYCSAEHLRQAEH